MEYKEIQLDKQTARIVTQMLAKENAQMVKHKKYKPRKTTKKPTK